MDTLQTLLGNNKLQNLDNIDSLLELSDLLKSLVKDKNYKFICNLIKYTIDENHIRAFTWIMEALQEEFDKKQKCLSEDFTCEIGKFIKNYDKLVSTLKVDFDSIENKVEKIYDKNNEVQSFFNISKYKTSYKNIFLISYENFDTKDNDYIEYKLSFTRDIT